MNNHINIQEWTGDPVALVLFSKLKEGRAYTLRELTGSTKIDINVAEDYLNKWKNEGWLGIRPNRQRDYYFLSDPEIIRSVLAVLKTGASDDSTKNPPSIPTGIKYSRHCYKHLAGYAGVKLEQALVDSGRLVRTNGEYKVTEKGWKWFALLDIYPKDFENDSRRLTRQCLDFSERKSHLAGRLGDALLTKMGEKGWVVPVQDSREIRFTEKGRNEIHKSLGLNL